MHHTQIRREILDRVLARRGRVHWFDTLDPAKTAALVIDSLVMRADQPKQRADLEGIRMPESQLAQLCSQMRVQVRAVLSPEQRIGANDGSRAGRRFLGARGLRILRTAAREDVRRF